MRRIIVCTVLVIAMVSCNKDDQPQPYLPPLVTDSLKVLTTDIPVAEYSDLVFVNPNTGYAISRTGGIVKTIDAGLHWTNLPSFAGAYLHRIQFINSTTGYIIGKDNTSGFLLKTIDAGQNWNMIRLNMAEYPSGVFFLNATTGFITGENKFIKTTDGGANWTDALPPADHFSDVKFCTPSEGYASSDNGKYYRTTNGGVNWQALQAETNDHLREICFTPSGNYVKTNSNALIDLGTGKKIAQAAQEATRLLFLNDVQAVGVGQHYEGGFWPYGDIVLSNNNWTDYVRQKYMPSEAIAFTALAQVSEHKILFIGTGHLQTTVVQLNY